MKICMASDVGCLCGKVVGLEELNCSGYEPGEWFGKNICKHRKDNQC